MNSYLKFLSRNKLYTVIEAVGLAVSLAFVILIGISIHDQLAIRNSVPTGTNLYLKSGIEYRNLQALTTFPEVKSAAAFTRRQLSIDLEEGKTPVYFLVVTPQILEFFPVETLEGNLDLFGERNGVLITEAAAKRLFPNQNPLDASVTVTDLSALSATKKEVTEPIIAVINPTVHSPFEDFDFVVSFSSQIPAIEEIKESDMLNQGFGSFVSVFADIVPGVDITAFDERIHNLQYGNRKTANDISESLPYQNIFFSTQNYYNLRQGKYLYLEILIFMALILLASSILNYINLSLAISGNRAKEMATRRLLGAGRDSIIWRTVAESLLFVSVCFIAALMIAQALVPVLNELRPEGFSVPFRLSADGTLLGIGLMVVLAAGLLAGLAPALFLASHRPLDIVTGQVRRKRKMGFNRICIVAQTVLSLVLIAVSIALDAQLKYMEKVDIGVTPQKDLYYFYPNVADSREGMDNLLSTFPQVKAVGHTSGFPSHPWAITAFGQQNYLFSVIDCDSIAFSMMGFRIQEKYTDPYPGTIWITEETKNAFGISQENHEDLSLFGITAQMGIQALGGIVDTYRRLPVNAKDPYESIHMTFLSAVQVVGPERTRGHLIQTTGNHADFEKEFKETVRNYYKEKKGLSDIFSHSGTVSGYMEDIIASDYDDLRRYVHLVELFTLVAILLSILGLIAMSTWYASSNAKDIAIRKVFGGTIGTEVWHTIRSYMVMVIIAAVIGIPLAIYATGIFLENYPERISNYSWVFLASTILMLAIAFLSVLWQTLKAAKTNPALELKKE